MRKGRCSNNPSDCSFAANGKLLPFAGTGSLCPECGAPLAMVSASQEDDQYESAPQRATRRREVYEEPPNQALEFAKIAAIIAVLGGGAFFGFKILNEKNANSNETPPMAISNAVTVPVVEDVMPAQVAKLIAPSDVRSAPDVTSASLGQLNAGAIIDVTGTINSNGVEWARISIPNQPNAGGFIEISKLMGISGAPFILGNVTIAPIESLPPAPPPPPVISEISDMPETIFYVSSPTANLRADAGVSAAKVGTGVLGDTLSVTGSRTVDGKTWYRINLPSGGEGWVNATLLSKTKPAPPPPEADKTVIPESKTSEIAEGSYVVITSEKARIVPEIGSETAIDASIQKGMAVQIQAVKEVDGKTWYQVRSKRFNIDGWVSSSSVKPVN